MKIDSSFNGKRSNYHQIMERIRGQIATGELKPDDRLPAIRTLAAVLNIDPGTVARAYLELTREGIIIARQGSGNYVAPVAADAAILKQRRQRLDRIMEKAIIEALGLGFSIEDLETVATVQLSEWRERRAPSSQKKIRSRKPDTIRFSGSHDLTVELLARHMATLPSPIHLETNFTGSLSGLMALEKGEAELAGSHLADDVTGEFNIGFIRKIMPNEAVVVMNLMQRVQGFIVAAGNPRQIIGVKDLMREDITFVNRQKGSGTRILLDSQLRKAGISPENIKGYEREETTHMAVAGLVARQVADVAMGAQSAAEVSGLGFIPLFKERYDLVALLAAFEQPRLQKLCAAVNSQGFRNMLSSISGYDITDSGKITRINPDPVSATGVSAPGKLELKANNQGAKV